MPRFRGINEAIRYHLERAQPRFDIPLSAPFASQFNVGTPLDSREDSAAPVLRWGFSTWGVESVTSEYKPGVTLDG